jgi:uncharacterized membrane protein
MRLGRDLLAAVAAAVAAATIILAGAPTPLRVVAGLPLLLVLPGYALGLAIVVAGSIGRIERVLVTVSLSLCTTILLTVLINLGPWRLSTTTWALGVSAATVVAAMVAAARGPAEEVHTLSWPNLRSRDILILAIAIVVVAASAALAWHPLPPPSTVRGYSELSLVRHGEGVRVDVGSFELRPRRYRLELFADEALVQFWTDIRLSAGQRWTRRVTLAGSDLEAILYRTDRPHSPYRAVRLFLPS